MPKEQAFLRLFTEAGPMTVVAVVVALLVAVTAPASAQFFNFGGPPRQAQPQPAQRSPGGWFGGDLFAPFQQQAHRIGTRLIAAQADSDLASAIDDLAARLR